MEAWETKSPAKQIWTLEEKGQGFQEDRYSGKKMSAVNKGQRGWKTEVGYRARGIK